MEADERRIRGKQGTPQGGIISPILANIFLHTVVDEFVYEWRKTRARGEVYIIRYADDSVIATEHRRDAEALLEALRSRFESFGLKLHPEKTRIVKFGRRWVEEHQRGKGKPGTFNFLGFTRTSGRDRKGRYLVKRKTMSKRRRRAIGNAVQELKKMMHIPVKDQCARLSKILKGHYNYYGVRGNFDSLSRYYSETVKGWYKQLRKRSQKGMLWEKFEYLLQLFPLPRPTITHSEGWLPVNPGYLLRRVPKLREKSARPVL